MKAKLADIEQHPLSRADLNVLLVVEGSIDIRVLVGLNEICNLSLLVPEATYGASGLKQRVKEIGLDIPVYEVPGGRILFQWNSFFKLLDLSKFVDVFLAQEMQRGALNCNIVGRLRNKPVVSWVGVPAIEYFKCRRKRKQIGIIPHLIGIFVLRTLLWVNGKLTQICITSGEYLKQDLEKKGANSRKAEAYGVDTNLFKPASQEERLRLRKQKNLPLDKFLIFLSVRISHEKDPETPLRAVAELRTQGIDAVIINLSGDYNKFEKLAINLGYQDCKEWVIAGPPAHPMLDLADYFRCVDVVMTSSLEEGCGMSCLESLACETPIVASDVGGMHTNLQGLAELIPVRDSAKMTAALKEIAKHPAKFKERSAQGRKFVEAEWNRTIAFESFQTALLEASGKTNPHIDKS